MDVTEPSTPEEVAVATMDDLLAHDPDIDAQFDTQVYAENVITALRAAGFLAPEEGDGQ